jgi:diadenosine tetraphosphatase ApaH/serine/threonine PP2A family protein phosphatase
MRIALLADLHANREAVEACLARVRALGCDRIVLLGDLVGYGADPQWVVDCVRQLVAHGAIVVRGNHDEAAAGAASEYMHVDAAAAIAWTAGRLDPEQRAFLARLPLQVEEDDRLYVHANAWAPERWGYVDSRLAATRCLEATDKRITFCGHVHTPALYHTQPGTAAQFAPHPGFAIPLSRARRWLAVVGACGQPRDGNPAACCALYDTDRDALTFLRVPYDAHAAARKIRDAGLPETLARRLLGGR